MTRPHREPEPRTPRPAAFIPPQPSEEDLRELREPDGLDLLPERPDGWPVKPFQYVVVLAASDWYKEHFPATSANLWDALHTGRDAEPDLEAEP